MRLSKVFHSKCITRQPVARRSIKQVAKATFLPKQLRVRQLQDLRPCTPLVHPCTTGALIRQHSSTRLRLNSSSSRLLIKSLPLLQPVNPLLPHIRCSVLPPIPVFRQPNNRRQVRASLLNSRPNSFSVRRSCLRYAIIHTEIETRVLCVAVPCSSCCVLPQYGLLPSLLALLLLLLVVYHFGNSRIPVLDCFLYLREFHFRLCHVLVQLLVYMFSCSINIFTLNLYIANTVSQLLFARRSRQ